MSTSHHCQYATVGLKSGSEEGFWTDSDVKICDSDMNSLEEWNTRYSVEDGVEEFMFPVLDSLVIKWCPRLRLKPCPPTFRDCIIYESDQVIFSLEEVDKTGHHCSSSIRAIRLFHHIPAIQELHITGRDEHAAPHFPWVVEVGLVPRHISTARMAGRPLLFKKPCHRRM